VVIDSQIAGVGKAPEEAPLKPKEVPQPKEPGDITSAG
jgi:hypothetical protein